MKNRIGLLVFALAGVSLFMACGEQTAGASEDPNTIVIAAESSSSYLELPASSAEGCGSECPGSQTAPRVQLVDEGGCSVDLYSITKFIGASFHTCMLDDSTHVYERVMINVGSNSETNMLYYTLNGNFYGGDAVCEKNYESFAEDCAKRNGVLSDDEDGCANGVLVLTCSLPLASEDSLLNSLGEYARQWCDDMSVRAVCPDIPLNLKRM